VWHLQQVLPLLTEEEDRRFVEAVIAFAPHADTGSFKEADTLVGQGFHLPKKARDAYDALRPTLPEALQWQAGRERHYAIEAALDCADVFRKLASVRYWKARELKARSMRAVAAKIRERRHCLSEARALNLEASNQAHDVHMNVSFALRSWSFGRAYQAALADP